jgi:hypothetical protein
MTQIMQPSNQMEFQETIRSMIASGAINYDFEGNLVLCNH